LPLARTSAPRAASMQPSAAPAARAFVEALIENLPVAVSSVGAGGAHDMPAPVSGGQVADAAAARGGRAPAPLTAWVKPARATTEHLLPSPLRTGRHGSDHARHRQNGRAPRAHRTATARPPLPAPAQTHLLQALRLPTPAPSASSPACAAQRGNRQRNDGGARPNRP